MKIFKFGIVAISIIFWGIVAQSHMSADSVYYTCPMHPEIITSKPGKCPKCGTDLVKKSVKKTMDKVEMKME